MTIKNRRLAAKSGRAGFAATASLLAALAASSCCIVPLTLFGLGATGAWIGNLTRLAPFQPYAIAATLACLGYGYWLVLRPAKVACRDNAVCGRPIPNRLVIAGLIVATVMVIAAFGFDLLAPLLLQT